MKKTVWAAALAVAASAVLAAGCGGSSGSSAESNSASTAGTTSGESSEAFDRSNWDLLASDPNSHKGANVDFVGRVFTTPERDEKGVYLQIWEDPANSESNTIVGYADPAFKVAQDDYVHVKGTVKGEFKGKNALGAEVSAVTVLADTLKVVDAVAAAPPALGTLGPRRQTQAGITVAIPKVEFAASETRVFVKVTNSSGSDATVYDTSMRAVQGGKQHDAGFSTNDYPELSSDLVSGASTSGVVVFPKMNPHGGLKLIIEVSSDTNVGDYGTLTYTFTWPG